MSMSVRSILVSMEALAKTDSMSTFAIVSQVTKENDASTKVTFASPTLANMAENVEATLTPTAASAVQDILAGTARPTSTTAEDSLARTEEVVLTTSAISAVFARPDSRGKLARAKWIPAYQTDVAMEPLVPPHRTIRTISVLVPWDSPADTVMWISTNVPSITHAETEPSVSILWAITSANAPLVTEVAIALLISTIVSMTLVKTEEHASTV